MTVTPTPEQKRIFLSSLRRSLGQLGLDIVHPFAAQSYNATTLGQSNPMPTFSQTSTLSIIVGSHKTFWKTFLAQHYPSKFTSEAEAKDPMDHYCERLIPRVTLQALQDAQLYSDKEGQEFTTPFSVAFSHWRITVPPAGTPPLGSKPTGFVAPPTTILPIQHVAQAAGFAYFNPIAFLNVHPVYGPWFGMRAIVMVDLPYDLSDNEELLITETNKTGTYSRDSKPIEVNPAFEKLAPEEIEVRNAALEVTKTALLTKGWNAEDWMDWVAFRQSLTQDRPDWIPWRYSDNQMRYHYQKKPEFLEECAIKFQQGQEQCTSPI
ncbi:hypothetical protein BKA57DRAFT_532078 [Linnemannia elongata]|uniref:Cyanocobalamin reductase (cyanide-eliminating) n=1 Tax=Linnemannia elongata AG-77 TaxID=1314771 RepID=A0A197JJ24_9FUNG|nr:hypothetical protein BGZ88_000296 [Linnemannia elongata]KAH7056426.1 hypothetical protein BKA57DRAFT_532078 [Linnemannia elongata]KAK5823439.1 hypothetical protein F5H01DRAFT_334458 [Linnemannia elongata]OAQ24978.1 hypothetical protein K457DRAFT_35495 [Linnemannia elongata AG-77]